MEEKQSRKKSQGRPKLDPLEKQRRLVARLFENIAEIERQLTKESGHDSADESESPLLLSTFNQRLAFAREAAQHEHTGRSAEAKAVRQKLNLFRPQGLTEEAWNALPDDAKRLAPGKPKMPKELELARLEIERDEDVKKLRELESASDEAPADLEKLQEQHGQTSVGRPGKDILGALDRQMHTAIYKRRDLVHRRTRELAEPEQDQEQQHGRPKKAFADRYDYFTGIIEHCHKQIVAGEAELPLIDLQRRLLKRLRDKATRIRLQLKTSLGTDLVRLRLDLPTVEKQIEEEADRLKYFEAEFDSMADIQRESLRKSAADKIRMIDSLENHEDYEDRMRIHGDHTVIKYNERDK
jgi:predicted outer membrane protein